MVTLRLFKINIKIIIVSFNWAAIRFSFICDKLDIEITF